MSDVPTVQWVLPLLGGLGIGTLITQVVTQFITRRASVRDRLYQEKRAAYLGLLEALHDAAALSSPENWRAYGRWQTRCSLFGSMDVMTAAQKQVDLKDAPGEQRDAAFHELLHAMRVDLGQSAPPLPGS
jgi:hypothetical protein